MASDTDITISLDKESKELIQKLERLLKPLPKMQCKYHKRENVIFNSGSILILECGCSYRIGIEVGGIKFYHEIKDS